MKRKKTRSVASYRAASLKGARTRKRMQWARPLEVYKDMQIEFINYLRPEELQEINYHGLPNPWFDMVRK